MCWSVSVGLKLLFCVCCLCPRILNTCACVYNVTAVMLSWEIHTDEIRMCSRRKEMKYEVLRFRLWWDPVVSCSCNF